MATIFKYNNELYQCLNLDKKLKRLKINKDDIDILYDNKDLNQSEIEKVYLDFLKEHTYSPEPVYNDVKLYYYKREDTQELMISIYDSINEMKENDLNKSYPYDLWKPITFDEYVKGFM
jgi:hypothetical protein